MDLIYDDRKAIYETITSTIDSAGDIIKDTIEEELKSVDNPVIGFVSGLGTVFC